MKNILLLSFLCTGLGAMAQNVGIGTNTPDPNAILELSSSTKGFLMPRVSDANMNAMPSPFQGMMLFNTTQARPYFYTGTWKKVMLEGDPFSLPYTGAGNTTSTLFSVTQNGAGLAATAIYGFNMQNGRGVAGFSESGEGISGTTNTGTAGYFATTSGKAIVGAGDVWLNKSLGKTMVGNLSSAEMQLHISDATDTALLLLDNNAALAINSNIGMYFKNGLWYTGAIKTTGTGTNVARLGFYTFAASNQNGLQERLSILDNGNIGVGTINPAAKLEVNGQVKITGGSPGLNKVLVSDAAGLASWSGAVAFGAYMTAGPATVTVNGLTSANVAFTVEDFDIGVSSNYNPATSTFTAPVAGVYHFHVSVSVSPQVTGQNLRINLEKNGSSIRDAAVVTQHLFSSYSFTLSADVNLVAGDQISVDLTNFSSSTVIINGQSTSGGVPTTYFNGHLVR